MTGVPQAKASTTGNPNPSRCEGKRTKAARIPLKMRL
jgi:hypothetical protein